MMQEHRTFPSSHHTGVTFRAVAEELGSRSVSTFTASAAHCLPHRMTMHLRRGRGEVCVRTKVSQLPWIAASTGIFFGSGSLGVKASAQSRMCWRTPSHGARPSRCLENLHGGCSPLRQRVVCTLWRNATFPGAHGLMNWGDTADRRPFAWHQGSPFFT
jgi:hypothetical protein